MIFLQVQTYSYFSNNTTGETYFGVCAEILSALSESLNFT